MTVFFGLAGASRHPREAEILTQMRRAAIQHWTAGPPTWPTREVTHARVDGSGALVAATSPPAWGPADACLTTEDAFWVACRGLICDRKGLLSLAGYGPSGETPSDAALVLALYRRQGLECFQHLSGDWSVALWDAQRQELILAKDPTGNCAMFWWRSSSGHLLFSNHLPALAAAPVVPRRPNAQWIAGLVTVFYDPFTPTATAFEAVHALPPGHLLRFRHGQPELFRWWNPGSLGEWPDARDDELTGRFLALYEDAVRERLARPGGEVAATLSGGLDSGSVVALAAPALARQGQMLKAYVQVPRFDAQASAVGRTANEWNLALATATSVGNVDLESCPTDHISPVRAIDLWLDRMAVPSHATAHWFWGLDIAAQAVGAGATVMLTGEGGNATVSYTGNGNLWGQVQKLRLGHVFQELAGEAGGTWVGFKNRLLKPALRPAWQACRRSVDDAFRLRGRPAWTDFGLVRPQFADAVDLAARMRAAHHDPGLRSFQKHRIKLWRAGLQGGDNTFAIGHSLATTYGLEWRDPTKDRRLVELCLRLPDEIFWNHGIQRGLIRSGMRHALPEQVLHCSAKGLQSSDLHDRLVENGAELLGTLASIQTHPTVREWFDIDRMQLSALEVVTGNANKSGAGVGAHDLLRALGAAAFVARHA